MYQTKQIEIMKRIFKNEIGQLFTLEDYCKVAGVSHANNITKHKDVSIIKARQMHSTGSLLYISGHGDRKVLTGRLKRGETYGNFKVN